ncbi:unnamed protein product, partial [Ectocarpus sp. 6 AP-2014]
AQTRVRGSARLQIQHLLCVRKIPKRLRPSFKARILHDGGCTNRFREILAENVPKSVKYNGYQQVGVLFPRVVHTTASGYSSNDRLDDIQSKPKMIMDPTAIPW